MTIRVLIADDHGVVRHGIKRVLNEQVDLEVVAEAADGLQALRRLREGDIQVLVTDLSMPGRSGVELLRQVRTEFPRLPVLVISMHPAEQYGVRVIKAGASGYLGKDCEPDEIVRAVRKVAGGGVYITPEVAEQLAFDRMPSAQRLPHEQLTDREFQIFHLLVSGQTLSEIAAQLSLSIKTVSTHKTRILEKMQLSKTADLFYYAIRHGLVEDSVDGTAASAD